MTNYQQMLVNKIFNEFDRLGVSTKQNSCSGLMIEEEPEIVVVKIYDDYDEGYYDAERLLDKLEHQNLLIGEIWQILREFEV